MNHNHSNTHSNLHLWLMIICCALPLILILAIGFFGLSLGSIAAWLPYAMILLCPLSMLLMMRGMGHDHGSAETHHVETPHRISTLPQAKITAGTDKANSESGQERCH